MSVGNYNVTNITDLVNDAMADALGTSVSITEQDTSYNVSMGKSVVDAAKVEGFYGALVNRITKTVYFVRDYNPSKRSVMHDESAWGAYVQKVYVDLADAVDNATWGIPDSSSEAYAQASPYDVEGTLGVSAMLFGDEGTWSIEVLRPIKQVKSALLNESEMISLVEALYMQIENSMQLQLEAMEAAAVNTSIANTILNGKEAQKRDLLTEWNVAHRTAILTPAEALESADFLKYAAQEIKLTTDYIQKMSRLFNTAGYATFTSRDRMVVEVLSKFAAAMDVYLQADTYHKEMVALPKYDTVAFWQYTGANFAFDDVSSISILNNAWADEDESYDGSVEATGIIAVIRDDEAAACHFGDRRSWEMVNPRSEVIIHGEKAEKGYAVDPHANEIVFMLGTYGEVSVTGDDITYELSSTAAVKGDVNVLDVTAAEGHTISKVEVKLSADGEYDEVAASDDGKYRAALAGNYCAWKVTTT